MRFNPIKLRYLWKEKWHYIDLSEPNAIEHLKVYYEKDGDDKKSRLFEWIGVKDSKGKDIYEGDLIATFYTEKLVKGEDGGIKCVQQTGYEVQEVMKVNGGFYASSEDEITIGKYIDDDVVEVIGNIRESPELLQMIDQMGNR